MLTNEEIGARLRPLIDLTDERNRLGEIAERLRYATDPVELAERNASGARMAELDDEIARSSVKVLDELGLIHAASLAERGLAAYDSEDGDLIG